MTVDLAQAVAWTARLAGFSIGLQSLELLWVRAACRDDGVWSWTFLQREHAVLPLPLRALFGALLPYRRYLALLVARGVLSVVLAFGGLLAAPALLVSQLAVGARFRGTFNGGSDYMTVVVLLGLTLTSTGNDHLASGGLGYICVQLVLSYFVAGVAKLLNPRWRDGDGLRRLLQNNRYGAPPWLVRGVALPGVAPVLTLGVLGFECLFPLALLGPRWAHSLLAVALLFHVGNVLAFGLNRFLFAWVAAYPALLYFCTRVG